MHKIGAEEYDGLAFRFENEKMKMLVDGEKGVEISGHWRCEAGTGEVSGVALFDVVKLAPDGFHFDEFGDNCITVQGGVWTFNDCEVLNLSQRNALGFLSGCLKKC